MVSQAKTWTNRLYIVLGLIIIAAACYFGLVAVRAILGLAAEVQATIFTFLGAFLIWLVRATYEARRDERRRGYEHRREVYLRLLDTILLIFGQAKSAKVMKEGEMVTKLREVSNQLFLEASDSVYKAFRRMLECAKAQEAASSDSERKLSSLKSIHSMGCFMLAMRKDIGFRKTELTEQDYLLQLLSDYDTHSDALQSLDCEE